MTQPSIDQDKFRKAFLLLLTIGISLIFFAMIRRFLTTLLLAAIFSGLAQPLYGRLLRLCRGRRAAASAITVTLVLLVIVVPMTGLLGIVATQAIQVSQTVRPAIQNLVNEPTALDEMLGRLPLYERLEPYQDQVIAKAGDLATGIGTFIVNTLAATTKGTVAFIFLLFVMLYSMFFFLIDGKTALNKILYYMPLSPEDENRLVEKFLSVSRATIKGSLVIGIVQGTLAGFGFWVVGIDGPVFWGMIMAVLSIIPGVGIALVWIPAVIYLVVTGRMAAAIALFIWSAGVAGTVDNFLRPRLIGKDTKMPDLLILLGTLGGLLLFGAVGIVIGPIIAALFLTVWDMYGAAFKDVLPATHLAGLPGGSEGGGGSGDEGGGGDGSGGG